MKLWKNYANYEKIKKWLIFYISYYVCFSWKFEFTKHKLLISNSFQRTGTKFIGKCIGSWSQNGLVHNSKVVFLNDLLKITEKLRIIVLKCWSILCDEKRINVPSVLQKKLLKIQRTNFFWTTRYKHKSSEIFSFYAQDQFKKRGNAINLFDMTCKQFKPKWMLQLDLGTTLRRYMA